MAVCCTEVDVKEFANGSIIVQGCTLLENQCIWVTCICSYDDMEVINFELHFSTHVKKIIPKLKF
jgi:hypothetical protein